MVGQLDAKEQHKFCSVCLLPSATDQQSALSTLTRSSHAGPDKRFGVDNVGTGPAALSSYLTLLTFKPDLLISSGTAGGFKAQGAAIADVFVGTKFVNHDRRNPIPVSLLSGTIKEFFSRTRKPTLPESLSNAQSSLPHPAAAVPGLLRVRVLGVRGAAHTQPAEGIGPQGKAP